VKFIALFRCGSVQPGPQAAWQPRWPAPAQLIKIKAAEAAANIVSTSETEGR